MDEYLSIIKTAAFIIINLYIGLCAGYWLFHRFFVILPSRKFCEKNKNTGIFSSCKTRVQKLPSDYGIDYEEVFFKTPDNKNLHGWLMSTRKPALKIKGDDAVIVFFPGNLGVITKFLPGLKQLVESGLKVFAFSYRGFGKSALAWPTEKGVYIDSEAAVNYLIQKGYKAQQLILYGQSLGCAMASRTAAIINPAGLILEGGFPSVAEFMKRYIPFFPFDTLTTSKFDTEFYLSKVVCPVLVAYSPEDKAIPGGFADTLFNAAISKKIKLKISGPHAKGLETTPALYLEAISEFISGKSDNPSFCTRN